MTFQTFKTIFGISFNLLTKNSVYVRKHFLFCFHVKLLKVLSQNLSENKDKNWDEMGCIIISNLVISSALCPSYPIHLFFFLLHNILFFSWLLLVSENFIKYINFVSDILFGHYFFPLQWSGCPAYNFISFWTKNGCDWLFRESNSAF